MIVLVVSIALILLLLEMRNLLPLFLETADSKKFDKNGNSEKNVLIGRGTQGVGNPAKFSSRLKQPKIHWTYFRIQFNGKTHTMSQRLSPENMGRILLYNN